MNLDQGTRFSIRWSGLSPAGGLTNPISQIADSHADPSERLHVAAGTGQVRGRPIRDFVQRLAERYPILPVATVSTFVRGVKATG